MWSLGVLGDIESRVPSSSLKIPAERVNFWAALRWHCTVHSEQGSAVNMLCLAALPQQGFLVLPMRLLDADVIARDHPEIASAGLMGEWKIDDEDKKGAPRLKLLRVCTSPHHFLSMLQSEQNHPRWMWPAYAGLQGASPASLLTGSR
jgi:hypothetical protein